MHFETKQFPMNEAGSNIVGAIILTTIIAGGLGYMVYLSNKKNNSVTIKKATIQ